MSKQGRPKNTYPYLQHDSGEAFRFIFDKAAETISLQAQGAFRTVNGISLGAVDPDWPSKLEQYVQTTISDTHCQHLEYILRTYIEERAGEIGAIPWSDKKEGFLDGLEQIDEAASALLAAFNKQTPATGYILQCIAQIKEPHFSRDEFYPQLTQLVARTHLLLQELTAEKKRGVRLGIGNAWRRFVFCMADVYLEMTGKEPMSTEINSGNEDTQKTSQFAEFALAAMMQVPVHLRDHDRGRSGRSGNIRSFSTALRGPLKQWKELRGFPQKRARNPR